MARLALLMFLLFVVGSMFFCLQETPVARRKHRMTGRRGVLAGDSAVLGGDLSNGREPVYLF